MLYEVITFVRLLEERKEPIVGRYFVEEGIAVVVPDDSRINHDIIIDKEHNLGARHGQIVVVEITHRPKPRFTAQGKITEVLGQEMQPGIEVEIALRTHGVITSYSIHYTKLYEQHLSSLKWRGLYT